MVEMPLLQVSLQAHGGILSLTSLDQYWTTKHCFHFACFAKGSSGMGVVHTGMRCRPTCWKDEISYLALTVALVSNKLLFLLLVASTSH